MRINGPGRPLAATIGSGARRSDGASGQFAPGGTAESPARAAATGGGPAGLSGLDALMALQAVDADRPRGRRRAVKRGHDLLDLLDEIKVGLLGGGVSSAALDRVLALVGGIEPSGDDRLDGLVADIALRAEVELAKLGRYRP